MHSCMHVFAQVCLCLCVYALCVCVCMVYVCVYHNELYQLTLSGYVFVNMIITLSKK